MTPDAPQRYVWACSVCGDTSWLRDGATLYGDARFCPTCGKPQPIIVFNGDDLFVTDRAAFSEGRSAYDPDGIA